MRHWTPEERERQAKLIRNWQPWKTGGVKTAKGKSVSRMNALRHGLHSEETKELKRIVALCGKSLKAIKKSLPGRQKKE